MQEVRPGKGAEVAEMGVFGGAEAVLEGVPGVAGELPGGCRGFPGGSVEEAAEIVFGVCDGEESIDAHEAHDGEQIAAGAVENGLSVSFGHSVAEVETHAEASGVSEGAVAAVDHERGDVVVFTVDGTRYGG